MEKYSFGKVDEKALANNFTKALKDDEFVKVANELIICEVIVCHRNRQVYLI